MGKSENCPNLGSPAGTGGRLEGAQVGSVRPAVIKVAWKTPESAVKKPMLGQHPPPPCAAVERRSQGHTQRAWDGQGSCLQRKQQGRTEGFPSRTRDPGWFWPSLYVNPLCFPFWQWKNDAFPGLHRDVRRLRWGQSFALQIRDRICPLCWEVLSAKEYLVPASALLSALPGVFENTV